MYLLLNRAYNRVPYSTSKGGVNGLTRYYHFEHAKDGIRVNAVATVNTETPPRKTPRNTIHCQIMKNNGCDIISIEPLTVHSGTLWRDSEQVECHLIFWHPMIHLI